MNDVLIVAYHYPPIVSGGTERAISLVRELPAHGYRPHVLTTRAFGDEGDGSVYRADELVGWYRKRFNPSLHDLPTHARSRTRTRSALSPLAAIARSFLIPDAQVTWLPSAYCTARNIIQSHPVRLIFTTGPPFSSHLLGYALHKTTHLPWVADFRDTWTYDPLEPALDASRLRRAIEERLEREVLAAASHATCVTEVAADQLSQTCRETQLTVVENGYTERAVAPETAEGPHPFRFVHTGSFSASHPARSPKPIVEAATSLREAGCSFEIVFVGSLTPDEQKMVEPLTSTRHAMMTGPVDRATAEGWQQKADALVVVDHPREVLASNVPGKVYEYGAAGKPILAIASRGATRQLIEASGAGLCVGHAPAKIAGAMRSLIDGSSGVQPNPAWWARFERRAGAKKMAAVFDRVLRMPG